MSEGNSTANSNSIPELVVELENPISIRSNFPALQSWLRVELIKYEIEVTSETLTDAKRAAAELNDLAKKLDRVRIDYAKKFKAPITEWEAEAKTLFEATIAAREKILEQTRVFDNKTRKLCKELMAAFLTECYAAAEVRQEYQNGFETIDTLVGISCVTKTGQLTKSAKESIEGLAQKSRLAQEKADGRMARVEADCRAAGVEPLTRDQVSSFLDLEDSAFLPRLAKMVADEVKRQESAREKIRKEEQEKAEREARIKAEADTRARAEAEAKAKKEQEDREAAEQARKVVAENVTPDPVPEPKLVPVRVDPPNETPTEPEEEKKIVALKFSFLVDVQAKISTHPEKVRRVMTGIVLAAIESCDYRIAKVEVIS